MVSQLKRIVTITIFSVSGFLSCAKQTMPPPDPENSVPPGEGGDPDGKEKKLIPVLISGKDLDMKLGYTESYQLRSVVNKEDSTVITYSTKQVAREISRFHKGILTEQAIFALNAAGLPEAMEHYAALKNSLNAIGSTQLIYDEQQRLKSVIRRDLAKNKLTELAFSYPDDQILEIRSYPDNRIFVYNNTAGHALFKYVKNAFIYGVDHLDPLFFSEITNIGKMQGPDAGTVSYTYNAALFPQAMEWKLNQETTILRISFKVITDP